MAKKNMKTFKKTNFMRNTRQLIINNQKALFWFLAAGILLFFSQGKYALAPLAWLAPAFLMRFVRITKIRYAYPASVVLSTICFYFTWRGLVPMPEVIFIVFAFFNSCLYMLVYLLDGLVQKRSKGVGLIFFPLAMVSLSYLSYSSSPYGTWGSPVYSQVENGPLLQLVAVTGIYGLEFLIYLLAPILNRLIESGLQEKKALWPGFVYGALVGLVFLAGVLSINDDSDRETIRTSAIAGELDWTTTRSGVNIVQKIAASEGFNEREWRDIESYWSKQRTSFLESSVRQARAGSRLVLWSEAIVAVRDKNRERFLSQVRELTLRHKFYLALTMAEFDSERSGKIKNRLMLIGPAGRILMDYQKYNLVPPEDQFTIQGRNELARVRLENFQLSAAICFDLDFPAFIRQAAGVDIFLAPANDWRDIKFEHANMARVRAVENGFNLLRSTGQGLSVASDYRGRILGKRDFFSSAERTLVVELPIRGRKTFYAQAGDFFPRACSLALIVLILTLIRLRFRARRTPEV